MVDYWDEKSSPTDLTPFVEIYPTDRVWTDLLDPVDGTPFTEIVESARIWLDIEVGVDATPWTEVFDEDGVFGTEPPPTSFGWGLGPYGLTPYGG